mmetsp:Transcript_17694/g.30924  ORF Transcript_17694/g.30924 Transcript_17694/m.30924 type:complete len:554 (-) Transcript_17694:76-1737(-)
MVLRRRSSPLTVNPCPCSTTSSSCGVTLVSLEDEKTDSLVNVTTKSLSSSSISSSSSLSSHSPLPCNHHHKKNYSSWFHQLRNRRQSRRQSHRRRRHNQIAKPQEHYNQKQQTENKNVQDDDDDDDHDDDHDDDDNIVDNIVTSSTRRDSLKSSEASCTTEQESTCWMSSHPSSSSTSSSCSSTSCSSSSSPSLSFEEELVQFEKQLMRSTQQGQGDKQEIHPPNDDDDDDDDRSFDSHEDGEPARVEEDNADVFSSAHLSHSRSDKDLLLVTIPDHSPEAVKILLEYCYTNRVVSLGYDAFVQSCKTRPSKHQGPVAPFHSSHHSSKKWPGNGSPQVSFSVALAAIRIAEESGMRRLSLMCEVAASQLVTTDNVTEALMMSTSQKSISGNDLPYLRKACMDVILARGPRGVLDLERSASFRTALDSQQAVIVPTLLKGTMEAVTSWEASKGIKRDSSEISYSSFEELDKEDKYAREKERRKRRKRPSDVDPEELYEDPIFGTWEADAAKRSLKRMSQHLDAINRRTATVSRGGSSFFATGSQRTSRRRRSKS